MKKSFFQFSVCNYALRFFRIAESFYSYLDKHVLENMGFANAIKWHHEYAQGQETCLLREKKPAFLFRGEYISYP